MEKRAKIWGNILTGLCFVFMLSSFAALAMRLRHGTVEAVNIAYMAMDCMGLTLMTVLLRGTIREQEGNPRLHLRLTVLLFSVIFAVYADFWVRATDRVNTSFAIRAGYTWNSLYYLANTAVIHAFAVYLRHFLPRWPRWAGIVHESVRVYFLLLAAVLCLNLRVPLLFTITDGAYVRMPLTVAAFAASGLFSAALLALIAIQRIDRTEKSCLLFYVLLPLTAMVLRSLSPDDLSFVPVTFVVATCSLYVGGHVRQHRLLQAQRLRAERQQTALTLSRLRPHFLCNTLTSAAYLCRRDPAQAEKVIMDFAGYLRSNLSALQSPEPIPFARELSHIRCYLNIERVRFAERLRVVYEIGTEDFLLPSLTVQPLVENAVRHGILQREEGGTVTIATRETAAAWEITVSDNGIGFDPARVDWDGGGHVGLISVQNRLRAYGDRLRLTSRPGEGTRVVITVPKQEDKV